MSGVPNPGSTRPEKPYALASLANKDFDPIMFPDRRHGFGSEPYMVRRRDYFVRHPMGAEPPREYEFDVPAPAPTR